MYAPAGWIRFGCLLLIATAPFLCGAQGQVTGIFLPVKCGRHIPTQVLALNAKSVCLAENPIVADAGFESVTDLAFYNDRVYFDVNLTQAAYAVLTKLQQSFPYTDLVMVVQGEPFMVFNMTDRRLNRIIRFQGHTQDTPVFSRINRALQRVVAEKDRL
jgi:hypothetical protein